MKELIPLWEQLKRVAHFKRRKVDIELKEKKAAQTLLSEFQITKFWTSFDKKV